MRINSRAPEGNAFAIMGAVQSLLEQSGRQADIPEAMERMKSGDYRNLCAVAEEVTFGSIVVYNLDDNEDDDED